MKKISLIMLVLVLACGVVFAGGKKEAAPSTKTINFWHLDTTDEQQAAWRQIADNFEAKHPGVKIEITCLENEAFKQKVATACSTITPPPHERKMSGGLPDWITVATFCLKASFSRHVISIFTPGCLASKLSAI